MSQSRREFLTQAGRVVVAVPAGFALLGSISCGSKEEDSCDEANTVEADADEIEVYSGCSDNHAHSFTIATSDLASPPTAGIDGSTSEAEGHAHAIALSQADLASIESGGTVNKVSGSADGHTHTFQFRKTA
jgi:hypothetical protein